MIGPGLPLPIFTPSIDTAGMTNAPAAVKNAMYDVVTAHFNGQYDSAAAVEALALGEAALQSIRDNMDGRRRPGVSSPDAGRSGR